MNTTPFSELKDYELIDKSQDIRGWPVKDEAGAQLGTVRDMLVDTDRERVVTLVLDNGKSVPATDVILADQVVLFGTRARASGSPTVGGAVAPTTATTAGEQVLPVVQEFLRVGKRDVNAGHVKVSTHVTSQPVQENVQLRQEHVSVERRPVDREVNPADVAQLRDQTVEVTARSEEAVVAKVARVIEEIVIRKDVGQRTETIRDSVKHTEVRVDDDAALDTNAYRQHFDSRYAQSGYSYDQYRPAYKFGHSMRDDGRFQGKNWAQVEPQARSTWEERNPGTWESFKDAIEHAWTNVTGT